MKKYYYRFANGKKKIITVTDEEFTQLRALDKEVHRKDYNEKRHTTPMSEIDDEDPCLIDPNGFLDENLAKKELIATVQNAIATLPADEQQLVNLYFYEEKNQAQIARILGISQSAVSQRLSKILQKLKKLLQNCL